MWNTIDDTYSFYPDLKRERSINVASFLYTEMEYLPSIVFHIERVTKKQVKRQKSRNVASFPYRERVENTNGVFMIDSIPHCLSGLNLCQ